MVLVYPLLLGLVVAALCGGDLRKLVQVRVRAIPLFYAGLALQLVAFPPRAMPWHTPDRVGVGLWLVSYACLVAAIAANVRLPGISIIAAGLVANLIAILANGGHMPVLPSAMRAAGNAYSVHFNSAAIAAPHVSWLVDRWAAPGWILGANVYSVGDMLMALGGFALPLAASGVRPLRLLGSLRGRTSTRAA